MLQRISIFASLILLPLQLSAACFQPLPRLVCAEYVHSHAVVIAKLTGTHQGQGQLG